MPKPFDTYLYNKCKETWNKIGREKYAKDGPYMVTYVALSEYLKTIEPDILQEPERVKMTDGKEIENPNLTYIKIIKEIILDIDNELELSFWDKKNEHKRRGRR